MRWAEATEWPLVPGAQAVEGRALVEMIDELRIECTFPAVDATAELCRTLARDNPDPSAGPSATP
jgi:hypothetical protein